MSTLNNGTRQFRCFRSLNAISPLGQRWRPVLQIGSRAFTTDGKAPATEELNPAFERAKALYSRPYVRALPISPSYFSRQSQFHDAVVRLSGLLVKHQGLPTIPADKAPPTAWKSVDDYRRNAGENVKTLEYQKALATVKRLNLIEPSLMPETVKDVLQEFKRDVDPFLNVKKDPVIDKFGRAIGVGRRKSSVARAWVVEGTGEVLVNGKPLTEAFGRVHDRESAIWALKSTQRVAKYNVWALVEGGGTTGQAEALTLAVAKGLLAHEPALKPALRRGLLQALFPREVPAQK
jgi:small subunit ribosomal protein S9